MSKSIIDLEEAKDLNSKDQFIFYSNSKKKAMRVDRDNMLTSPGVKTALNITGDTEAPSTPTGLIVTSESEITPDGRERIILKAVLSPNPESDVASYGWKIRRASGNLISITNGVPLYDQGQAFDAFFAVSPAPGGLNATNKITNSWEVAAFTYYEVRVCATDQSGNTSDYTTLDANSLIRTAKDTTPPATPTNVTIGSALKSVFLDWTNPSDKDLAYINIYRNTTNNFSTSTLITNVYGASYTDTTTSQGTTYYYWLKAVDFSGNESVNPSTAVSITPGLVQATDINNFAVDATKLYANVIVLTGDSWSDNSPAGGSVAWSAHTLVYGGASYSISSGNTSNKYIYWTGGTTYQTSNTNPTLTDNQFMIATNTNGSHDLAWNGLANAVIGTAYIQDAAINNAKISEVYADKIRTGSITSQTITLDSGGVLKSSGVTNFTDGVGFWLEGGGAPKFGIGDLGNANNGYLKFESNLLTVKGTIQATAGTFGASLGTSVTQGILIDADGLLVKSTTGNGRIAANINWSSSGSGSFTPTSTSGFYLGGYNGTYRFFIGNTGAAGLGVGANSLYWNGSSLAINGSLTGTIQSGTQLGSSGDSSFGLILNSNYGIRHGAAGNAGIITITAGVANGATNGAQLELHGNGSTGNQGLVTLQAGTGSVSSIRLFTNLGSGGTTGTLRFDIDTYGTVSITKNASSGGSYTTNGSTGGAGCLFVYSNLGVGVAPDPITSVGGNTGYVNVGTELSVGSITLTASSGQVSATSYVTTSSKRFKKKIKNLKNGLDTISKLRPVKFDWKNKENKDDVGLIAEEVALVLPNLIGYDKNKEIAGLDYSRLTPILIQAVKELSLEIEALKKKIKYNADPNKL